MQWAGLEGRGGRTQEKRETGWGGGRGNHVWKYRLHGVNYWVDSQMRNGGSQLVENWDGIWIFELESLDFVLGFSVEA